MNMLRELIIAASIVHLCCRNRLQRTLLQFSLLAALLHKLVQNLELLEFKLLASLKADLPHLLLELQLHIQHQKFWINLRHLALVIQHGDLLLDVAIHLVLPLLVLEHLEFVIVLQLFTLLGLLNGCDLERVILSRLHLAVVGRPHLVPESRDDGDQNDPHGILHAACHGIDDPFLHVLPGERGLQLSSRCSLQRLPFGLCVGTSGHARCCSSLGLLSSHGRGGLALLSSNLHSGPALFCCNCNICPRLDSPRIKAEDDLEQSHFREPWVHASDKDSRQPAEPLT
mmetsp:Transcript_75051/g.160810  ORF Transcript_75051/g.160810 Transcript_75051/m.160810 type:complete len:285 (+) Transcript_75051:261-1115(+)